MDNKNTKKASILHFFKRKNSNSPPRAPRGNSLCSDVTNSGNPIKILVTEQQQPNEEKITHDDTNNVSCILFYFSN